MNYVLFDGQHHQKLKPLTLTRPVADLRVGIFKIQDKWKKILDQEVGIRSKDYLASKFNSNIEEVLYGISGALCPNEELCDAIHSLKDKTIMMKDGNVLAIKPLPKEEDLEKELEKYKVVEYTEGVNLIDRPMDIFLMNGQEILNDLSFIDTESIHSTEYGAGNLLLGDDIFIEEGAEINGATLNSTTGPIYIGKGVEIMEGSNIRGPFAILDDSILKMGAKVYGPTTIGPQCKVGGEVSNVVFQGYANKAHDGFAGNTVVGYWCNLGADTNTSNLKNNYGEVKSWSYATEEYEPTGTQYCGLIMGDHSKSSINTMFNTGTVIGAFVNVFDSGFPPKFIPSFSWGSKAGFETYDFDKAMEVAGVVMQRRGLELDDVSKSIYKAIFKQKTK